VPDPSFVNDPLPEKIAPDWMYESEELVIERLPPFKVSEAPISTEPPSSVRFNALEVLDIAAFISIVPPVNVNVALEPDVLEIAALTVSVLDEELPVVTETLTPELSEVLMDEAKIVVVVDGVNVAE
jgi:hypothetical protein